MRIYDIRINGAQPGLLMPASGLRFSWKTEADSDGFYQKAYRITLSGANGTVFDTGRVESGISVDVEPEELATGFETVYTLKIEVEGADGTTASGEAVFTTEPGPDGMHGAKWIKPEEHISGWAPYMRTKFDIGSKKPALAVLYRTGLGIGEFFLNGERADDFEIDPPISNYEKTVYYRATDVTKMLKEGGNCLAVLLGEGFYSQSRVWGSTGMVYGDVCVFARLKIVFEDGSEENIVSGTENWKYKYSPISINNIYGGEMYDSRLETPDFALFEGSEKGWGPVVEDTTPKGKLTPCLMPPVRAIREIPCISVHGDSGKSDGAWIFDLGVNFAGTYEVRIPAHSPRGAVYVFRTAEALSPGGTLDHRSTGGFATQCIQQEIYIARGDSEPEYYRPRLTYHGFRYVEITGIHDFSKGYGTEPDPGMIKGIALATDMKEAGRFYCDYDRLTQLDRVMRNTYLSNFHGVPEDCPAREKCGWLGDAEVVCNWGLLNYDSETSYEKYLGDIRTTTEVYGTWMMISPGKRGCGEASPLWGCAQIIIPYWMWKYRGLGSAVRNNIDLMRKWVEHELNRSNDFIIREGLGDWCPPLGNEGARRMPVEHSSTLMFFEICRKMAEISDAFGYGDGDKYRELSEKIRESFNRHFYNASAHSYGYWGTNGAALITGIYPDGDYSKLLEATVAQIENDGYKMSTGIYGNKYLVPALFDAGEGSAAMKFLFKPDYFSFGRMLETGGTSMWEAPDMSFVTENRNIGVASYNHPMHGGFLLFCHENVGGIKPLEPGFKKFLVKPCFIEEIGAADVSYESPYGEIRVAYGPAEGGVRRVTVVVPANTTARIEIPGAEAKTAGSGEWVFDVQVV